MEKILFGLANQIADRLDANSENLLVQRCETA
jgi:hypothetical protein